jgi:multidrug efflux pump subunit AcrA (membrane-fusion protein)
MKMTTLLFCGISLLALAGCDGKSKPDAQSANTAPAASAAPVTNRIDIPETVRRNLGITFAKVERRRVAATLRVPGRFELLPSARREYRAAVPGPVQLLVKQYDRVETGTPLYQLQSPEWLKLRQQLQDDQAAAKQAAADVAAAEASKAEAEQAVAMLQERVALLAEAGTRRAELESQLAERKASLRRLEAEANAKRAAAEAAAQRYPLTIATAAALTGIPTDQLNEQVQPPDGSETLVPRWRTLDHVEVRAAQAGVVEAFGVTSGSWAEQAQLLVSTVDPQALRFRASGLQADLGRLNTGAAAAIIPPRGVTAGPNDAMPGKLILGLEANADTRTVELIITPDALAPWARAGVSAYAEVVTDGSAEAELAIPVAAVVQDELSHIFFRRDPKDPNKAIRVEGDLGISDGRWVVVSSGLKEGDEVVLAGVYELKLTGSGKTGGGDGHFHADGTWHPAGTPEDKEH